MADVSPDTDDPFAVLGVDPRTPLQEIESQASDLNARYEDDDIIKAINEAFAEIMSGPHVKRIDGTCIEPLVLQVDPTRSTVGDAVHVSVTDLASEPVRNATLYVDEVTEGHTDRNGTERLTLRSPGERTIRASKSHPNADWEYQSQSERVTVTRRQRQLKFEDPTDAATTGESIDLTIVDENGHPVRGVTIGSPQSESEPTDESGATTLTPSTAGSNVVLTASKSGSSNLSYQDATTSINISKREIDLAFADPPDSVTFDDPTTLRVVDGKTGKNVRDATVTVGGETATTDNSGRAKLQFNQAGIDQVTVTASKPERNSVVYDDAETTVHVAAHEIELSITIDGDPIVVGTDVALIVTDEDGNRVHDAFINAAGKGNTRTDRQGRATLQFDATGEVVVTASKSNAPPVYDYKPAQETITVEARKEYLNLETNPIRPIVGETFGVTVTNSMDEPVENAKVTVEDGTNAFTDDEGRGFVRVSDAGKKRVHAAKSGSKTVKYAPITEPIHARERHQLQFETTPEDVTVGDTAVVAVTDGHGEPVADAKIRVDQGTNARTDDQGRAYIQFKSAGDHGIKATKPPTKTDDYQYASTSISVGHKHRTLNIESVPSSVAVNDLFTVRITVSGNPVPDVSVNLQDGERATTDHNGRATLSCNKTGQKRISASKPTNERVRYNSTYDHIAVSPPSIFDIVGTGVLLATVSLGIITAGLVGFLLPRLPTIPIHSTILNIQTTLLFTCLGLFPAVVHVCETRSGHLETVYLGATVLGSVAIVSALTPSLEVLLPYAFAGIVSAAVSGVLLRRYDFPGTPLVRMSFLLTGELIVFSALVCAIAVERTRGPISVISLTVVILIARSLRHYRTELAAR